MFSLYRSHGNATNIPELALKGRIQRCFVFGEFKVWFIFNLYQFVLYPDLYQVEYNKTTSYAAGCLSVEITEHNTAFLMRCYVLDICLFANLSAALRYFILKCYWKQMGFT